MGTKGDSCLEPRWKRLLVGGFIGSPPTPPGLRVDPEAQSWAYPFVDAQRSEPELRDDNQKPSRHVMHTKWCTTYSYRVRS